MANKKVDRTKAKKNETSASRVVKKDGAMGSPPFVFDPRQVTVFGMYAATYETMAEFFGCSIDTIARRMKDEDSDFCRAYKKGRGSALMKLREAQLQKALSGDSTMLIWLGKQLLGQSDRIDEKVDVHQPIRLVVDETDMNA